MGSAGRGRSSRSVRVSLFIQHCLRCRPGVGGAAELAQILIGNTLKQPLNDFSFKTPNRSQVNEDATPKEFGASIRRFGCRWVHSVRAPGKNTVPTGLSAGGVRVLIDPSMALHQRSQFEETKTVHTGTSASEVARDGRTERRNQTDDLSMRITADCLSPKGQAGDEAKDRRVAVTVRIDNEHLKAIARCLAFAQTKLHDDLSPFDRCDLVQIHELIENYEMNRRVCDALNLFHGN